MPLTRRSAIALLAIAPLTGCAFEPITWENPSAAPTVDQSADDAALVPEEYFNRSPDSAPKLLPEGTTTMQRISTPHFDARLDRRFAGPRLGAQTMAQVYEPGAVRAPEGFELIAFTLQAGRPFYAETGSATAVLEVLVGDSTALPLAAPFGVFDQTTRRFERQWVLTVLAVPLGADVALRVRDEGKAVEVNLRTGAPRVDDAWAANAGFRQPVSIEVTGEQQVFTRELATLPTDGTPPQTSTFKFGIAPEASRGLVPWNPEDGWADPGTQWLRVDNHARVLFEPVGAPAVVMEIDVPKSFQYTEGTAAPIPALRPKTMTTDAIRDGVAPMEVTWMVPAQENRAIFTCNPVGRAEAHYSDHAPIPMEYTGQADPLVFVLSITPLEESW